MGKIYPAILNMVLHINEDNRVWISKDFTPCVTVKVGSKAKRQHHRNIQNYFLSLGHTLLIVDVDDEGRNTYHFSQL